MTEKEKAENWLRKREKEKEELQKAEENYLKGQIALAEALGIYKCLKCFNRTLVKKRNSNVKNKGRRRFKGGK